ncbi:hypothetical protein CPB86DRAFT_164540 [Serendipita vermifera]|nr:hypothetical protein CPB86DRAFT_164540 [Serendipita vermifera]
MSNNLDILVLEQPPVRATSVLIRKCLLYLQLSPLFSPSILAPFFCETTMSNFASNRDLSSCSSDDTLCTPITISSKRSDLPPIRSESERFDLAIHGLSKTAKRIKEASRHLPLVSPLEATMGLLTTVLDYIHVANKNRDVWTTFLECLGDCMQTALEKIEMLSPNDELCTSIQLFEG